MPMLQGTAKWAKIVGAPVKAYDPAEKEWTIDIEIDEETQARLREDGAGFYIRVKEGRAPYIQFKRKALKKDGTPAKPYIIKDRHRQDWDQSKLIGNGSVINVIYEYNEVGVGKDKRNKPSAIKFQVWEHVPYESENDFPDGGADDDWSTEAA